MYDVGYIVGLPNDLEIRLDLKQTPQTVSHSWMIVRYHNCDEGNHCFRPDNYLWHFGGGLNSTLVGCPKVVQFAVTTKQGALAA
jgi:hypothetical protein